MSGALGFSKLLPRGLPSSLAGASAQFLTPKINGWSITPEFRFYPGKKEEHQAPHGFYFAPYARYAKYSISSGFSEVYDDGVNAVTYVSGDVEVYYKGLGFGLMIGSQWIIGNHFSIDWFILGGHGGNGKVGFEITSPNIGTLTAQQKQEFEVDLAKSVADVADGVTVDISGNTAKVQAPAKFIGVRGLGLNLGYAF
jgi:hypothetical protein